MRPTPIPDHEVWEGAVRRVIGPPGGDLDAGIDPVEALVDRSPSTGALNLSVRLVLEDGDLEQLAAGGTVWLTFWGSMVPWAASVVAAKPPPGDDPLPSPVTLSDAQADDVREAAALDVAHADVDTWPRTVATAEVTARVAAARELATARRELEQLRRWKSEALEVIGGLQELGRALGLKPGARITGPEAVAAVEALIAHEPIEHHDRVVCGTCDWDPAMPGQPATWADHLRAAVDDAS